MFKVELHLFSKQPMNVNNNTAYIFVNKRPSNNDNTKTKSLIVRQNQHVANIPYINYMGNLASTFYFRLKDLRLSHCGTGFSLVKRVENSCGKQLGKDHYPL